MKICEKLEKMAEIPIDISIYENYAMLRASHKQRKEELFTRHKEIRNQIEAEFRRRIDDVNNECQRDTHQLNFVLAKEEATWRKNKMAMKPVVSGGGGRGGVVTKKRNADQDQVERFSPNDYRPTPLNPIDENRVSEGGHSNVAKRPRKSIMDVATKLRKESAIAAAALAASTAVVESPQQQPHQQTQQQQQIIRSGIMEMASNMRVAPLMLSEDEPEIQFVGETSSPIPSKQPPVNMVKQEPVSPLKDDCLDEACILASEPRV